MALRKRRVRKHVIADLSVNHVDYFLLKAGHTMAVDQKDYGYDGSIVTFSSTGEIENGYAFIQLKATDHIDKKKRGNAFLFSISAKDIDLWHSEPFPVYLVLFDAVNEVGYWLYLQKYFETNHIKPSTLKGKSLRVPISAADVVGPATPAIWRDHKTKILSMISGKISHV